MIQYILESTIIWLMLYALYKIFLQKETFFRLNRIYLLSSLIAGLTLPLINIPIGYQSAIAVYELDLVSLVSQSTDASVLTSSNALPSFNWTFIILYFAYFSGMLLLLWQFIANLFRILTIYRKGNKRVFEDHTLILMQTDWNPFSFFNWMFIPESIRKEGNFNLIRKHELAHIRQWHSLDILIIEIFRIAFWFNPLIRSYKKALVENHEYLADQSSLKSTERYNYGNLLLSFNSIHPNLYLSNQLHNSIIKNRITMMYKKNSSQINKLKYLLVLPLFAAMFFFISCEQKEEVKNENPDQELKIPKESEYSESLKDEVFKVVEQMPRFPGCENEDNDPIRYECSKTKLVKYIYGNIKYPDEARKGGIEGTVVAQFVVDEKGSILDAKVIRDIGYGCGEEVLKIVNSMNDMEEKWTPGQQRGEKVKVMFTLPVKFKLEDKEEPK